MFALLIVFSVCYFPFNAPVIEGTTDNWVEEVSEYVANSGVCFVMFVQKRSPRCKAIFPDFQEAANNSIGMVKYLSVDIKEHPKLAHLYTVRAVPAFRIVHPKGVTEYKGDTSPESLTDASFKLIPNRAKIVDETWLPSPTTPLSAVLFTQRKVVPPFWAALSCSSTSARIGITRSQPLMAKFTPAAPIAFIHKDIVAAYDGPLTYSAVSAALAEFEADPKASGSQVSLVSTLESRAQFDQFCRNTGKFCVVEVFTENPKFDEIAKTNHNGPFRFFRCGKTMFQSPGNYVIFHAKRAASISVESIDDLPAALDHVIDGGAKWTQLSEEL